MGTKRKQSNLPKGVKPGAADKAPGAADKAIVEPKPLFGHPATVLALGAIASAAFATYCNSLAGPLIFDDRIWIIEDPCIRRLWPIWGVLFPPLDMLVRGRPMLTLSLAINYAISGLNVWGYHVTNVAIHLLAAWTLFGITRRTLVLPALRRRFASAATPLALITATLWMIHPLQTEAVTYVVQRTESLAGLFYLLTLYCVIRGATSARTIAWNIAAVAACLLGIATKEILFTAPLMVLLYDRTFLAGSFREAWRQRRGLYLALTAAWALVLILLASSRFYSGTTGFAVRSFTWWSYLLTQSGVIVHYLKLAFWPVGLCLDYSWPPAETIGEIVLPGILVVGLMGLTLWALVKRPAWGFLGAWFFVILAPTSSFIPIKDAAFEHRMYLSLAALAAGLVAACWLAGQWLARRGTISPPALSLAGALLAMIVGVPLAIAAFHRNSDYRSELSIWQATAAAVPNNARARDSFGLALVKTGELDKGIAEFQEALKLLPKYADAEANLGAALANFGRPDEAVIHCQKAMEYNPGFAPAYFNLGTILMGRRQFDEAIDLFEKALKLWPYFAQAQVSLGQALADTGHPDEALVHYQQALAVAPELMEAHNNIGTVFIERNMVDEAIQHFRIAVAIRPDCVTARANLASALARCGHFDEALAQWREVLNLNPGFLGAYIGIGMILGGNDRFDEAIAQFQTALRLKPDFAEAYNCLGLTLARRGDIGGAVLQFRKAVKIKPDFADAQQNLKDAMEQQAQENEKPSKLETPPPDVPQR